MHQIPTPQSDTPRSRVTVGTAQDLPCCHSLTWVRCNYIDVTLPRERVELATLGRRRRWPEVQAARTTWAKNAKLETNSMKIHTNLFERPSKGRSNRFQ